MAAKYAPLNRAASDEAEIVVPLPAPVRSGLQGLYLHFKDSFKSLSTCPRELYVNFFLKFCESYGYFSISQILVIYLHTEFGASDVRSGAVYGIWGAAITFWGLSISWLNDNFGVRNSLMLGFSISLISSLILATATSITTIYMVLFLFMPIGTAMGIPMLTVGIKRYTNTSNRGFAFGLYYSIMNVAAFVAGPIVDMFNIGFKNGITVFGVRWSGNRLVILSTTCTYTASLVVTFLYLREIRVQQELVEEGSVHVSGDGGNGGNSSGDSVHSGGVSNGDSGEGDIEMQHLPSDRITDRNMVHSPLSTISEDQGLYSDNLDLPGSRHRTTTNSTTTTTTSTNNNTNNTNTITATTTNGAEVETFTPEQRTLYSIWGELLYSPTFWRFSVLTLFLINLNTIFRHLDATLPTYLIRCFGPNYPKGAIYSINPFIIMWLTPVIAALTTKYAHFDMIKYGGYVAAVSPFFMVMATQTWAVVLFVVLLSFGEAIWSPRVYDYTMTIAPEGREASFSALAAAPLFAAKVPVGLLSGYLVHKYLPEDGSTQDGQTMWLIIGLLTLSSPILITVFESCIREPLPASHTKRSFSAATLPLSTDSLDTSQSPLHAGRGSGRGRGGGSEYANLPDVDADLGGEGYEEVDFAAARTSSTDGLIHHTHHAHQHSHQHSQQHTQQHSQHHMREQSTQRVSRQDRVNSPVHKYEVGDTVEL